MSRLDNIAVVDGSKANIRSGREVRIRESNRQLIALIGSFAYKADNPTIGRPYRRSASLMARLKAQHDPDLLLNPGIAGRLSAGFALLSTSAARRNRQG